MDLLALDWFNENPVTSELRLYLVDRLLPTLVLGIEKVNFVYLNNLNLDLIAYIIAVKSFSVRSKFILIFNTFSIKCLNYSKTRTYLCQKYLNLLHE